MAERNHLSRRSKAISKTVLGNGTQAMMDAKAKSLSGKYKKTVYDLSVAENWSIRPELVKLFKKALQTGLNSEHLSYSDSIAGDTKLLQALASFFNDYFQPHRAVSPSHLAVGPGASSCLDSLVHHICDPGDGVLVPAPFWNGFDFHFGIRAEVHPVIAHVGDHFRDSFDSDAVLAALTKAFDEASRPIRALVITNPHNPLGQCHFLETLRRCASFCQERDLQLICDELYALSYFGNPNLDPVPFVSILALDLESLGCDLSRVHMVWSMSKDFGCSGIRQGCIVSQDNPELILSLNLPMSTQVPSLSAICTTALLTSPTLPGLIALNAKRLARSYKVITSFLDSHRVQYIPATAGLYIFAWIAPSAETWDAEASLARRLADSGVLVSAGKTYHLRDDEKGWFRLTFALPLSDLKRALSIIENSLGWASHMTSERRPRKRLRKV